MARRWLVKEIRPSFPGGVAGPRGSGNITSMALSRKEATTIALDPDTNRLLSRAARERGVSRSEFIRQHLALVLEQYRTHPKPASAGVVGTLRDRGDESELFGGAER
jgi:Ribbon-helix-helix protein, copG family